MSNYFKLNSECYLILGKKRSVIHNILNDEMVWITEENTCKLVDAEANKPIDKSIEIFNKLVEMGWGFFSEKPVFVDKVRPINGFNQKKLWLDTQNINFATLQITNKCNLDCSFCSTAFCPTCLKFIEQNDEELSLNDWKKIIDELVLFGTKTILITGGEPALYKQIDELLKYCVKKGLNVNLHTNGIIAIRMIPKEVNLMITVFKASNLNSALKNYSEHKNVILLSEEEDYKSVKAKVNNTWKVTKTFSIKNKTVITKNNLNNTGISRFFARKFTDSCLNGKIAISFNGNVYPCFGSKISIGNLKEKNISKVVKILIKDYWKKTIDKTSSMERCTLCEFKYACNSCKFINVNESCTYSLEEGIWK